MAGRIDYAVSVTPIQIDDVFQGVTQEVIDEEVGKTLSASKSNLAWAGSPVATPNWESGAADYYQSGDSANTFAVDAGAEGLWIKHSGFNYDSSKANNLGTVVNDELVTVTGGTDAICKLKKGEAIFLPLPTAQTITFTDAGTAAAMEVAVLT